MSSRAVPTLIVGGGIAGSELAYGLAQAGVPVVLVTTSLDTIGNLPADGLRFDPPPGGVLERVAEEARDAAGAWRSWPLHRGVKRELERAPSLHVLQSNVTGVLAEAGRVTGVATWEGIDRPAARVALCVGTFLRARLEVGMLRERAGRLSEMAYDDLYDDLVAHGVRFVDAVSSLAGDEVTPGYSVRYRVLAADELAPDGALLRLPGAFAFGRCAGGGEELAAAAAEGAAAAARWASSAA